MLAIRECILTKNDCYKAGRYITPRGIMIHSTGSNNPYLLRYLGPDDGIIGTNKYGNDWNRSGVGACVHGFIGLDNDDNVRVYKTLPWNMRGWHCGASGNDTHISFEICEDDLGSREYFEATKDAAVELCAYLCHEFNLDPMGQGVIVDHAEGYRLGIASGHADISHWWNKYNYTVAMFRSEVSKKLKEYDEVTRQEVEEIVSVAVQSAVENAIKPYIDREIRDLIGNIYNPKVYKHIEDIPMYYRPTIQKLVDEGHLRGDGKGNYNLTEDACRLLVIAHRKEEAHNTIKEEQ